MVSEPEKSVKPLIEVIPKKKLIVPEITPITSYVLKINK